jgi:hypothetical protein
MGGGVAGGAGGGTAGGSGGGGPPAGCGPGTSQPCATGCCNGSGSTATCLPGTAGAACGKNAIACAACNAASGQMCVDQVCFGTNPIPDAGPDLFGAPCVADVDCAPLGGTYKCKLATSSDNAPYPGGYCTKTCAANADCSPTLALCVTVNESYGETESICWNRCSQNDPCRTPGYACYQVSSANACWLAPLPTLDAGPRSDKSGAACTLKTDCINPPADGFCRTELLADGGSSEYPGGSCSAGCRIDKNHCGDAGVCVNYACEMACDAPLQGKGICRPGYVCGTISLPDAGISAVGQCRGGCSDAGVTCPQGFACAAEDAGAAVAGYCCDSLRCL